MSVCLTSALRACLNKNRLEQANNGTMWKKSRFSRICEGYVQNFQGITMSLASNHPDSYAFLSPKPTNNIFGISMTTVIRLIPSEFGVLDDGFNVFDIMNLK